MTSSAAPETQSTIQPGGILSKLPKELRLHIYGMIFPPGKINLFSIRDHLKLAPAGESRFVGHYSPRQTARDFIALLATCRAIHDEAEFILYENTDFAIHCSWDLVSREIIEHQMGPTAARTYGVSWCNRLSEVNVFNHLQHARAISLHVYLDENTMVEESWMYEMPIELSNSLNLQELHILVRSVAATHSAAFQSQAKTTMTFLGRI